MLHIKPKIMAALMVCVMMMLAMGGVTLGEEASAGDARTIRLFVDGYELMFQGELTEGMTWREIPETPEADLRFCMTVRGGIDVQLFTMTLMQPMGDYAMMLEDPQGSEVPVSFEMAARPAGLTEDEKWEFTWAQADVFVLMKTLTLTASPEGEKSQEQEEPLRLVTDAFDLTYAARWRSKVRVTPDPDGSLVFNAVIDDVLYPAFTLRYDTDAGDYVIVLRNPQGRSVDISFEMANAPKELTAEQRKAFYAVQEVVNEIADTLTLR